MKYQSIIYFSLTSWKWKSCIGYCVINFHDIEPIIHFCGWFIRKYFVAFWSVTRELRFEILVTRRFKNTWFLWHFHRQDTTAWNRQALLSKKIIKSIHFFLKIGIKFIIGKQQRYDRIRFSVLTSRFYHYSMVNFVLTCW